MVESLATNPLSRKILLSDYETMLNAVIADPDSDLCRLEIADWIEKHGRDTFAYPTERADFIRVQIEIANASEDSIAKRALAVEADELLDNLFDWKESFIDPDGYHVFERGFLESLEVSVGSLPSIAQDIFSLCPLRALSVVNLGGRVEFLRYIPVNNHLRSLDLSGANLKAAELLEIANSIRFAKLKTLILTCNWLEDDAASIICGEPFFQRLELIRCGSNPMSRSARSRLVDHFEDRICFKPIRTDNRLFRFAGEEIRDYFPVGVGKNDTQLLFGSLSQVAVFDPLGNLLRIDQRDKSIGDSDFQEWLDELGFSPFPIQVKRFQFPDGSGVFDFNWWAQLFEKSDDPSRKRFANQEAQKMIEQWLCNRQFEWRYASTNHSDAASSNLWFDGLGRVTDT